MVNRGRSAGCNTCKQRRVKCDEARPDCQRCMRLGLECGGYEPIARGLRFKDQTSKFSDKPLQRHSSERRPEDGADRPALTDLTASTSSQSPDDSSYFGSEQHQEVVTLSPDDQDAAIDFFLTHMVTAGRDMTSSRGFFEIIPPVLSTEGRNSALGLAVAAVATRLWSVIREERSNLDSPHEPFVQACSRLHIDVRDPVKKNSEGTILAALVLQLYDNISAVFGCHGASDTHFAGAEALLNSQWLDSVESEHQALILAHLINTAVSTAVREKRQVPNRVYSWMQRDVFTSMPLNLSSKLDLIGVSVAHHQSEFSEMISSDLSIFSFRVLEDKWREIHNTDTRLQQWLLSLPDDWHPKRLHSIPIRDPPIPTFSGACDLYPSVQIATIWNVFRTYRLILTKIKMVLAHTTSGFMKTAQGTYARRMGGAECPIQLDNDVRHLVDSICDSLPFYLGNRWEPVKIPVLSANKCALPSFLDLSPDSPAFVKYVEGGHFLSREDHNGHVLIQGPWHILNPLSHLLSLLSEDFGDLLGSALWPGQRDWIRQQFLRAAALMRLDHGQYHNPPDDDRIEVRGDQVKAEFIAKEIRERFRKTSGF